MTGCFDSEARMPKFKVSVGYYFYDDNKKEANEIAHSNYVIDAIDERNSLDIIENKLNLLFLKHPMYYGASTSRLRDE